MADLFSLPKLGFGLMRLPLRGEEIDCDALNGMVDEFLKKGFTYFDTAYVYHGGESEKVVKTAIVERHPRDSFALATKLPAWELHKQEDVQRVFDEQLARTGAGYFDFYLLHSIEEAHLRTYDRFDCWQWAQEMKKRGLIRHFGFSFHDSPELLDEVLTEHPEVEFVQLQINYVDWENRIVQSGGCYEVARKHQKPIIVMEPVKGGMLATMKPEWEARLRTAAPGRSVSSWALRFCIALDGVAVVLSGMSTQEQLLDNIATVQSYAPFTEQEAQCLNEVVQEFLASPTIGCTGCRYCIDGCSKHINIPGIFNAYNTVLTYGDHDRPHFYYASVTANDGAACACAQCGQCEAVCPQHLKISELLTKASAVFDATKE